MSLTLEAGKFYRTRDGRRIGPARYEGGDRWDVEGSHSSVHYTDGRYGGKDEGMTIVAEYPAEVAPEDRAKRQADALEAIAASLATIAQHLAPTTAVNAKTSNWIEETVGNATATDGWIEWHGGERPVPDDTQVDVKFRGGTNGPAYNVPATNYDASEYKDGSQPAGIARSWWQHYGQWHDIIAYRVHAK